MVKPKKRKTGNEMKQEKDANSTVKRLITVNTNNGLSPTFDKQPETFKVKHPALSFLAFRVVNSERHDELLAQCT